MSHAPVGSDLRKVVKDGYPSSNVFGCDLHREYLMLGHKLYQDADTCAINFFTADIFDVSTTPSPDAPAASHPHDCHDLESLRGRLTHIYTGSLFHLFDEDNQRALALRLALLLTRKSGAVMFGRHQGMNEEGLIGDHLGRSVSVPCPYLLSLAESCFFYPRAHWRRIRYGHSPASWTRMWLDVFTTLEGETFARDKVVIEAKLVEESLPGIPIKYPSLFWSVSII